MFWLGAIIGILAAVYAMGVLIAWNILHFGDFVPRPINPWLIPIIAFGWPFWGIVKLARRRENE